MGNMTGMPETTQQQPLSRRWFQFRLRTLFLVTAIAAVAAHLISREIEERRRWNRICNRSQFSRGLLLRPASLSVMNVAWTGRSRMNRFAR